MDRIKGRWADTELADDNVTSYVWRPLGTDQQGRYPEAAHAACELDDEPHDPMTSAEKRLIVVIYVVSAVLVVMLGAHALAWWGVL